MNIILANCLKAAKKEIPNCNFTDYREYDEYYLFIGNESGRSKSIPINKKDSSYRKQWESSDMFLDKCIYEGKIVE